MAVKNADTVYSFVAFPNGRSSTLVDSANKYESQGYTVTILSSIYAQDGANAFGENCDEPGNGSGDYKVCMSVGDSCVYVGRE